MEKWCPTLKDWCKTSKCAWWFSFSGDPQCAIHSLAQNAFKQACCEFIVDWVPIKEGLPEMADKHGTISDKVLVAYGVNDKQVKFGWLRGEEWVTSDMVPFARQDLITHWMPLPEAPRN